MPVYSQGKVRASSARQNLWFIPDCQNISASLRYCDLFSVYVAVG